MSAPGPIDPATPPPAAPAPPAYTQPAAPVPGRTLGIVAFVVSIFFSLIGLILGIVALVQSRRAGAKNGWAVAAIIVGAVLFVLTVIIVILAVVGASELIRMCGDLGPGTHQVNRVTMTCGG